MGTNLGSLLLTTGIGRFISHDINITMIEMAACWLRSEKRNPFGVACVYETMLLPGTWMAPETPAPVSALLSVNFMIVSDCRRSFEGGYLGA